MVAAQKVGVAMNENDIDDVFRAGQYIEGQPTKKFPRPVVVRLLGRRTPDDLVKAVKARKNLSSDGIAGGEPVRIYFNERLTKKKDISWRSRSCVKLWLSLLLGSKRPYFCSPL